MTQLKNDLICKLTLFNGSVYARKIPLNKYDVKIRTFSFFIPTQLIAIKFAIKAFHLQELFETYYETLWALLNFGALNNFFLNLIPVKCWYFQFKVNRRKVKWNKFSTKPNKMILILKNIYSGYNYWFNENLGENVGVSDDLWFNLECCVCSDHRTKDLFLMGSPWPVIGLVVVYLFIVRNGQRWMKDKPAFELKTTINVYNIFQVVSNIYVFIMVGDYWLNS